MAKKGMDQRVLVTTIKKEKEGFSVEADRVLAIGKIRSALFLPLTVDLSSVSRTASNPYGLILKRVRQNPEKENVKEDTK